MSAFFHRAAERSGGVGVAVVGGARYGGRGVVDVDLRGVRVGARRRVAAQVRGGAADDEAEVAGVAVRGRVAADVGGARRVAARVVTFAVLGPTVAVPERPGVGHDVELRARAGPGADLVADVGAGAGAVAGGVRDRLVEHDFGVDVGAGIHRAGERRGGGFVAEVAATRRGYGRTGGGLVVEDRDVDVHGTAAFGADRKSNHPGERVGVLRRGDRERLRVVPTVAMDVESGPVERDQAGGPGEDIDGVAARRLRSQREGHVGRAALVDGEGRGRDVFERLRGGEARQAAQREQAGGGQEPQSGATPGGALWRPFRGTNGRADCGPADHGVTSHDAVPVGAGGGGQNLDIHFFTVP